MDVNEKTVVIAVVVNAFLTRTWDNSNTLYLRPCVIKHIFSGSPVALIINCCAIIRILHLNKKDRGSINIRLVISLGYIIFCYKRRG